MRAFRLQASPSPKPQRVHLPTGRVVELKARGDLRPRRRAAGGLLFSELTDLVASGDVAVVEQSEAVDPGTLQLGDFHALRAIAARLGWLAEEPIAIQCPNCGCVGKVMRRVSVPFNMPVRGGTGAGRQAHLPR